LKGSEKLLTNSSFGSFAVGNTNPADPRRRFLEGGHQMSESEARLREVLAKIAQLASAAASENGYSSGYAHHDDEDDAVTQDSQEEVLVCMPRNLPKRLLMKAAETAMQINPVNSLAIGPPSCSGSGLA
jgi:hypothetical protein